MIVCNFQCINFLTEQNIFSAIAFLFTNSIHYLQSVCLLTLFFKQFHKTICVFVILENNKNSHIHLAHDHAILSSYRANLYQGNFLLASVDKLSCSKNIFVYFQSPFDSSVYFLPDQVLFVIHGFLHQAGQFDLLMMNC